MHGLPAPRPLPSPQPQLSSESEEVAADVFVFAGVTFEMKEGYLIVTAVQRRRAGSSSTLSYGDRLLRCYTGYLYRPRSIKDFESCKSALRAATPRRALRRMHYA